MKYKLFLALLMVGLLVSTFGTAYAQGPQPVDESLWTSPAALDTLTARDSKSDTSLAPVSEGAADESVWTSPDAARALEGLREPKSSQPPAAVKGSDPSLTTSPITNGNFEQGATGWSQSSAQSNTIVTKSRPSGVTTHSGSWIAWFNSGYDNNENATLMKSNITIMAPAYLRLFYWTASSDYCGYDYAYLKINSSVITTWNLCSSNNTYGWQPLTVDLSGYSGMTVSISIKLTTDYSFWSGMLVDDVSLYTIFSDVPVGYWAESYIHRLYNAGVTGGCGVGMYCPETRVTRDQMAVFLLRGIHGSGYTPPDTGGVTGFTDVPASYWAAAWIKELAAEGITGGCGNGKFCPDLPVTRDQMAVFLLRSKYGSAYTPPALVGGTGFTDVPNDHWAAAWIKQLVAEGITAGCGAGTYCPNTVVNRAQMAVFLVRTFNLP